MCNNITQDAKNSIMQGTNISSSTIGRATNANNLIGIVGNPTSATASIKSGYK